MPSTQTHCGHALPTGVSICRGWCLAWLEASSHTWLSGGFSQAPPLAMCAASHPYSLVQTSALLIWMSVWGLQEQSLPGPHLIRSVLPCKETWLYALLSPKGGLSPPPRTFPSRRSQRTLFPFSLSYQKSLIRNKDCLITSPKQSLVINPLVKKLSTSFSENSKVGKELRIGICNVKKKKQVSN